MCYKVAWVTGKTGCTTCTNWTTSFEVSRFRTKTHLLQRHFIFLNLFQLQTFVRSVCTIRGHAINFQPFQSSFAVLFNFRVILAQNKSWNAWKIANEVRKGLRSDDEALNGAYWMQKKSWVQICLKNWNAFGTEEFSSKTLTLRKRLSSSYTKCSQFLS